jgi:hypothetical protein
MAKKKKAKKGASLHKIAHGIFLLGFALAIILGGLFPKNLLFATVLVLLSLIIGALNTKALEYHNFQTATIVLLLAAWSFKLIPLIGGYFVNIIDYLIIFISPAACIAALAHIYRVASED